jgi:ABC-2 type transport system permease protein
MSARLSPTKAVVIARTQMVRSLRDRMSLFFVLVLPMILIVVLGMTYGGMSTARIGLADEDGGPLASNLANAIGDAGMPLDVRHYQTTDELRDAVERGFVEIGLVIHSGYDAALQNGGTGTVEYVSQPGSYATAIRTALDAAVTEQAALVRAARHAVQVNGVAFDAALAAARSEAGSIGRIEVPVTTVGDVTENPNGYAVGAESQVILFMFLTSMTGAVALVTTRQLGISRREYSTPTSAGTIVFGETLGRFAFALFQGVFIVVATWLLFGVDWIDPVATGAIILLFALVASGAAMLLATFVSNEHQLSALGPALGMSLALLGGAMVPIEVFPPVMRTLAMATPHAWALDAFHELLLNGGGFVDIVPELGVLLAFSVGLLLLASFRFRRQITGGAA